jgi:hypothetical protein
MRAIVIAFGLLLAQAQGTSWQEWQHLAGVVDVGGVRSDGRLVVMANGRLFLVDPGSGTSAPFAQGADGYAGSPDAEPYFIVTPTLALAEPGCSYAQDDVYILDLTSPPGIARVDASGHASRFATVNNLDTLNGIALDTVGDFGNKLLITGTANNQQRVLAVDCQGALATIADAAPSMEGGLAVAPRSFGAFGGQLIGPDENSDQVWAIAADGTATLVLKAGLPSGGDTGVESLGFVPANASAAYLADRATANNPFPGTDSILRLDAATLQSSGVSEGDLLVATEGGGTAVAIRCTTTCSTFNVASGPRDGKTGHIEGHITLTTQPAP